MDVFDLIAMNGTGSPFLFCTATLRRWSASTKAAARWWWMRPAKSGRAGVPGAALGPGIVLPFRYTAASKSQLAYDFLAAVNGKRFTVSGAESADEGANTLRRDLLRQWKWSTRCGRIR